VLELPGVNLTMGGESEEDGKWPFCGATQAARAMGATHIETKSVDEICVDDNNKIVTTPAYMCGIAKPDEIFQSVGNMVQQVMKLMR
jgi:enhancing lycopene biosynthesis protein 2